VANEDASSCNIDVGGGWHTAVDQPDRAGGSAYAETSSLVEDRYWDRGRTEFEVELVGDSGRATLQCRGRKHERYDAGSGLAI
jgi:hypothetical protein